MSMMMNQFKNKSGFFIDLGFVILSAVLFAASFPNILIKNGLPFLAWFAYIPILAVIRKYNPLICVFWGIIYGLAAYSLFNYWLGSFHPAAGIIVYSIYAVYLAVVFLLLKLAEIFFYKNAAGGEVSRAYLIQWIIWLAYEYLSTKGFLGYPYGITGYTQWQFLPLIQIAGITGIWGVSALVTFPSFWLAGILPQTMRTSANKKNLIKDYCRILLKDKMPAIIWLAALTASLIYGFININGYSSKIASGDFKTARIALVQHNTDPWEASKAPSHWQRIEAYRKDLSILKQLSDEALASSPRPQMVVWPETAFIPRIYWHATYRSDQESWTVVRELLEYLSNQDVPFLIGNDDARMDSEGNRIDYNAAMLFENGIHTATYRKLHLVPFTEHFPYKKQFPEFYKWLEKADTHFWEKGNEETIFSGHGFKFSTPICFEDTFGYLSRNFTRKGADVFINLTNDAWSKSLSAQKQHLSMAVFRSAENYRPTVRATISGQTCVIDPTGKVTAEAAPFSKNYLNAEIILLNQKKSTIYTKYGDYLGVFFTCAAVIILIFGAAWYTIRKQKIIK